MRGRRPSATLSISSMKTMPVCSTRSTACSRTASMSTSRAASSAARTSSAAGTFMRRRRVCFGSRPPSRSLNWMPISSTPWGVKIEIVGRRAGVSRARSRPRARRARRRAACARSFSRVSAGRAARPRRDPGRSAPGGGRAAAAARRAGAPRRAPRPSRCTARFSSSRTSATPSLGQVADDRLDVAPDVADLGELRGLDLDERRLGELRQPARDLGLSDAGRADHDDVLGRDLVAQLLRHLLAAPAVAQRDRDRALGLALADDVAVELRDDLARREAAAASLTAASPP